jgi:hypothetical protein
MKSLNSLRVFGLFYACPSLAPGSAAADLALRKKAPAIAEAFR